MKATVTRAPVTTGATRVANPTVSRELLDAAAQGALSSPSLALSLRFAGGKTTESQVIEANGSNVLVTPAAGKAPTLYWIALEVVEVGTKEVLAEVFVGSQKPYTWYLGAFMHWEPVVGKANDTISVKLSAAVKVAVIYTYTEG